jgi:autotransporter-associated beta strand protein
LATATAALQSPNRVRWPLGLLAALVCLLTVTPVQAATRIWTNSVGDLKWSTGVNWTPNVVPLSADIARFDTNGSVATANTVNCIVDVNTNILSLYLMNSNSLCFHDIQVADGVTLTIISPPTGYSIYNFAQVALSVANPVTNTITGPNGAIVINPVTAQGYLGVKQGATSDGAASMNTLDMSGLGTFTANLNRVYIAGDGATGAGDRPQGTWKMARTNTIVCISDPPIGFLVGNENSGNEGVGGIVELGQTNAIFANTGIGVGLRGVSDSQMHFGSSIQNGYAYFRSINGSRQNRWQIGDAGLNQSGVWGVQVNDRPTKGTVDFTGGTLDALVDALAVGRAQTNAGTVFDTTGAAEGYLTFDKGRLDVNTATIAYAPRRYCSKTIGQVNVDSTAHLVVNNYVLLGNFQDTNTASNAKLNIGTKSGGGSVSVYGNLYTITNDLSYGTSPNDSEIHLQNGGSLYVKGSVGPLNTLELNGSTLTLDYGANSPASTPICVTVNLSTGPSSSLNVLGTSFPATGQFPLIKYQSLLSGNGFSDITFTMPSAIKGYFSNNVANSSFDLVITNVLTTTWTGQTNSLNVGDWDIGATGNWKNQLGAASAYSQPSAPGNAVIFNDTAPGTTTVNLTTGALSPISITVDNSSLAYTFTGSGGLTGITSLTKNGSGSLTIGNSGLNNFTGPISVNGGTLQLSGGANRLPTNAVVILADASGVTLDLNGQNQMLSGVTGGASSAITLGSGTLTLSGGGVTYNGVISGGGRLVKTNIGVSATQTLTGANTYGGGTLISGPTTLMVLNSSGSGLGTGNVDIENGGTLQIGNGGSGSIAAAAITDNGTLSINVNDADMTFSPVISGSGAVTKANTGLMRLTTANSYSGLTTIVDGQVRISNSAALGTADGSTYISNLRDCRLEIEGGITTAEPLTIQSKFLAYTDKWTALLNVSGTNTLTGPLLVVSGGTLPSDWVFRSDAGRLVLRGPISNIGGGDRHYWLRGDGDGEVYADMPGPKNNLNKDGLGTWTLWGTNTYIGATYVQAGTLVVNGGIQNSTGVVNSGTLTGSGWIACGVTNFGGVLVPGNSIGSLTISNWLDLSLGGTCAFEVGNSACDQIRGLTGVVFGGTLQVTVVGTLNGVEAFKLFDAQSYNGTFGSLDLPSLTAPLAWDTTALETQGILRVTGGITVATNGMVGGQMQFSGTGPATNGYRVFATTNIALPFSQWTEAGSGTFAADGSFTFTDTNTGSYELRFYRMVTP